LPFSYDSPLGLAIALAEAGKTTPCANANIRFGAFRPMNRAAKIPVSVGLGKSAKNARWHMQC
jgi:hypothetical protein